MCLCNYRRRLLNSYVPRLGDAVAYLTKQTGLDTWVRTMEWAYGVTTVPARFDMLTNTTLPSLAAAGFDKPRLFVDCQDDTPLPPYPDLNVTIREENIGTVGNWMLALVELMIRHPHADRYAIFQDDIIMLPNTREYLDKIEYPEDGYINLYTFPVNEKLKHRRNGLYRSNQEGKGATALVFDRAAAFTVATSKHMTNKPMCPRKGKISVDGGIVSAIRQGGKYEYVHYPSLTQHMGDVSSMGNRRHPKSASFPGKDYDATKLLEKTNADSTTPKTEDPQPQDEWVPDLPIAILGTCDNSDQSKILQILAESNPGARWWVLPSDNAHSKVPLPKGAGLWQGRSQQQIKAFLSGCNTLYLTHLAYDRTILMVAKSLGVAITLFTTEKQLPQALSGLPDRVVHFESFTRYE